MNRKQLLRHVLLFYALCSLLPAAYAQCGLQSGPMDGFSDMLEVTVWVQTKCAQDVRMRYWLPGQPDSAWMSAKVSTTAEHGYCALLTATHLTPGTVYNYEIWIDDEPVQLPYPASFETQALWQYRTDPPDFTFVAASCAYINEPPYDRPGGAYGGGYQIFESMHEDYPDMMVWLGDNIYLREVDWNIKSGIYHRYTDMRSLPELQPLLASTHHYAIWDDHDYGPNDSDRSFWGKDMTLQAFKDFWANPNYGVGGTEGITGTFFWQDCQFFLTDDRWYRGPRDSGSDFLGQTQLKWLVEALRYSSATFKFICVGGQVINSAHVFETYSQFTTEHTALLDSIDKYNIKGVIFLTGDRHHSEISRQQTADGDVWYDITASPMTSQPSPHPDEPNRFRIPGSMVGERNYALISVSGPLNKRVCKVTFKSIGGDTLYEYTLH